MYESKTISEILKNHKDILSLAKEQQTKHDTATHCGTDFSARNRKVCHHCHVSGAFLFAAFNNCNLQSKTTSRKRKATVNQIFNNQKTKIRRMNASFSPLCSKLKCYYAHFVIKHFKNEYTEKKKTDGKPSSPSKTNAFAENSRVRGGHLLTVTLSV